MSNHGLTRRISVYRPLLIVYAVAFVISMVSVTLAYRTGSKAWIAQFSGVNSVEWRGLRIEITRAALFLSAIGITLATVFGRESEALLTRFDKSVPLWGTRVAFLILAGAFAYVEANRMVFTKSAAKQLTVWAERNGIEPNPKPAAGGKKKEARPTGLEVDDNIEAYKWYLPYAIVNYVMLGFPLVFVAVYGVTYDIRQIADSANAVLEKGDDELCDSFVRFRHNCLGMAHRYVWILALLSAHFAFEELWGHETLSDEGRETLYAMWSICFGVVLCPAMIAYYYGAVVDGIRRRQLDWCDRNWTTENALGQFWNELLFSGQAGVILACLSTVVLKSYL